MRLVLSYLALALAMAAAALWRRRFHFRVRLQVLADLLLLALLFHALGRHGDRLAMIFLLPALEAGALTSLPFALFAAAVSALTVLGEPMMQTLVARQTAPALLGAGLYGLVFMIAALLMYLLANRQLAQEQLALARERELRLQQLVNRLMVNDMQDGVMLLRANGAVVAANPAAVVLLGVQPAERGGDPRAAGAQREAILFDLRRIPRLQPLAEMLRDWLRSRDDAPRILQLLPLPLRPSSGGGPILHTRLRLRFLLPGVAGLRSTFAASLSTHTLGSASSMRTAAWNGCRPGRLRACAWPSRRTRRCRSPEDEALLRSGCATPCWCISRAGSASPSRSSRRSWPRWDGWWPAWRIRSAIRWRRSARPASCWRTPDGAARGPRATSTRACCASSATTCGGSTRWSRTCCRCRAARVPSAVPWT